MLQPVRVGMVVGVLESLVLLDRGGVGRMKFVCFVHQSVKAESCMAIVVRSLGGSRLSKTTLSCSSITT